MFFQSHRQSYCFFFYLFAYRLRVGTEKLNFYLQFGCKFWKLGGLGISLYRVIFICPEKYDEQVFANLYNFFVVSGVRCRGECGCAEILYDLSRVGHAAGAVYRDGI